MKSFFAAFLIALLVTGCAALTEKKKERTLEQAMMYYERAIRWVDFEAAARLQRGKGTAAGSAVPPGSIRVTAYRPVNSRVLADGNEVRITVQIDYYNSDTLKVVTLTDEQTWEYDPGETAWYITTPLPAFR
jgi:outer membrane lipoprotein-sorting protein